MNANDLIIGPQSQYYIRYNSHVYTAKHISRLWCIPTKIQRLSATECLFRPTALILKLFTYIRVVKRTPEYPNILSKYTFMLNLLIYATLCRRSKGVSLLENIANTILYPAKWATQIFNRTIDEVKHIPARCEIHTMPWRHFGLPMIHN